MDFEGLPGESLTENIQKALIHVLWLQ